MCIIHKVFILNGIVFQNRCSPGADAIKTTSPRMEEGLARPHEPRTATAAAGAAEEVTFVTADLPVRKLVRDFSENS